MFILYLLNYVKSELIRVIPDCDADCRKNMLYVKYAPPQNAFNENNFCINKIDIRNKQKCELTVNVVPATVNTVTPVVTQPVLVQNPQPVHVIPTVRAPVQMTSVRIQQPAVSVPCATCTVQEPKVNVTVQETPKVTVQPVQTPTTVVYTQHPTIIQQPVQTVQVPVIQRVIQQVVETPTVVKQMITVTDTVVRVIPKIETVKSQIQPQKVIPVQYCAINPTINAECITEKKFENKNCINCVNVPQTATTKQNVTSNQVNMQMVPIQNMLQFRNNQMYTPQYPTTQGVQVGFSAFSCLNNIIYCYRPSDQAEFSYYPIYQPYYPFGHFNPYLQSYMQQNTQNQEKKQAPAPPPQVEKKIVVQKNAEPPKMDETPKKNDVEKKKEEFMKMQENNVQTEEIRKKNQKEEKKETKSEKKEEKTETSKDFSSHTGTKSFNFDSFNGLDKSESVNENADETENEKYDIEKSIDADFEDTKLKSEKKLESKESKKKRSMRTDKDVKQALLEDDSLATQLKDLKYLKNFTGRELESKLKQIERISNTHQSDPLEPNNIHKYLYKQIYKQLSANRNIGNRYNSRKNDEIMREKKIKERLDSIIYIDENNKLLRDKVVNDFIMDGNLDSRGRNYKPPDQIELSDSFSAYSPKKRNNDDESQSNDDQIVFLSELVH